MPISRPQVRPAWADTGDSADVVDPGNAFVTRGFPSSAVPPARQFLNWVLNYCTNGIRYLCRRGIADYDPTETYSVHDIVRGDDGGLYESQTRANVGNTPSTSSQWGSIGIYHRTPEEVAAGVTPVSFAYPELNVLRYGADGSGRAPSDEAISTALAVACPMAGSGRNARYVHFPVGQYLVTKTINLTNTRQAGTRVKDGLTIKGDSAGGTRLIGQTGEGKAVIETTGSQWLSMEDFTISSATSGASTVGIFQGLSTTLPQTNNQKFVRLVIYMNDDAGANGGAGSVGIWNFAAEENTYDTIWVNANLPLMFTAHNPSPNTGFKTPASYQHLATSHSLGMRTFTGECFLVTINKRQPSIITEDVNSIKFSNAYFANIGVGGSNQSAWKACGSLIGVAFSGLIETHARLLDVTGIVAGAQMRVTFGGIDSAATERILLNRGVQGQLLNCDFNIIDNAAPSRPLLAVNPSAVGEQVSCFIANCAFRVNCDQRYTVIQENLLWNPKTGNITVEALHDGVKPYKYCIDSNRTQEVAIPATKCSSASGDTAAELIRVVLPTVAGNRNALSASVSVEGIAHIADPASDSVSCKFIEAQVTLAMSSSGGVTVATGTRFVGQTVNTHAAGNDITELSISATLSADGKFIRIAAMAARTGSANEAVEFVGSARLRWSGNEARAPRLQIPA
jgi:hypothetical protein